LFLDDVFSNSNDKSKDGLVALMMVDSIAAKCDLVQKLRFSSTNAQTLKWMRIMMVFLVREILAFNRE
jgi:hypothetical protein